MTCRILLFYVLLSVGFLISSGAPSLAQTPKVMIIAAVPKSDVQQSFGLVENSDTEAANNRQKLQTKIDAGPPRYPWFVPGGNGDLQPYYVGSTVILKNSGREICGIGARNPFGGSQKKYGSYLLIHAERPEVATTFNGGSKTATATIKEPTVLHLNGTSARPVVEQDRYNSFEITGGTHFIQGWYTITDVNTTDNTWTLDRACVQDDDGSAMTGFYCPTLIQDRGVGTVVRDMGFLGRRVNDDTLRASIGYHAITANQSPNNIGVGIPTGKHHFENCSWSDFHTAILYGAGMAKYGQSVEDWYGWDFINADESTFTNLFFDNVDNCFVARNSQAVGFLFNKVQVTQLRDTVFRFDSGGKFTANGVEVAGSAPNSRQRVLHLGKRVIGGQPDGHDPFILNGVTFDGGQNTRNPQLITTDWEGVETSVRVEFNGVMINRASPNENLPLIDIQSRCYLTVRNAANGFWNGSVQLRYGRAFNAIGTFAQRSNHNNQPAGFAYIAVDGDGASITEPRWFVREGATPGVWSAAASPRTPQLVFYNTTISATAIASLIDTAHSHPGIKIWFYACLDANRDPIEDQVYTIPL